MSFIDSNGQSIESHSLGVQPIKSLSAVSATGAGTALDGVVSRANAVATITSSAGTSAGSVVLEGSLDGINYITLGSAVTNQCGQHHVHRGCDQQLHAICSRSGCHAYQRRDNLGVGVPVGMTRLTYLDDLDVEPRAEKAKPKGVKHVRVLSPFQVVHDGKAYWPDAVVTVPAALADRWIANQWVTEKVAT
jgi:hypothetical protein